MAISKKRLDDDPILGPIVNAEGAKKPRTLYLNDQLFLALQTYCEEINETNEGKKIKPGTVIDKLIMQFLEERKRLPK